MLQPIDRESNDRANMKLALTTRVIAVTSRYNFDCLSKLFRPVVIADSLADGLLPVLRAMV